MCEGRQNVTSKCNECKDVKTQKQTKKPTMQAVTGIQATEKY